MLNNSSLNKPYENNELVGHVNIQEQLYRLYKSGLTTNSIILRGLKGIGKATLAFKFAFYLQHNAVSDKDAVNFEPFNNTDYSRDIDLLLSGGHPNVMHVHPYMFEEDNLRGDIKIDHIRWLKNKLTGTIFNKYMRVCIIDSIGNANISACNALLKMIEEPPINTMFILINHSNETIIKTIKSRCMIINVSDLDINDIEEIAKKNIDNFDLNEFKKMTKYNISPGIIENLQKNNVLEIRNELNDILNNMPYSDINKIINMSNSLSKKINEERFFILIELLFLWINKKVHNLIELDVNKLIIYKWTDCWSENSIKYKALKELNLNKEHFILNLIEDVNDLMKID